MKIAAAKEFVIAMNNAIAKAEAEGRDELTTGDIDQFQALDDAARADLQSAIDQAEKG